MGKVASAIRDIAATWNGRMLAAAEFKQTVHLYDLETRQLVRTIDTTMDFGGSRLALSNDGQILIAGAYHVHGIAGYSTVSGAEIWRRKDLKKVQRICFNTDNSEVICCFDSQPCQFLDAQTGKSIRQIRGVRNAWASSLASVRLLESIKGYSLRHDEAEIVHIPKLSFAALRVVFSPAQCFLTEAKGFVRSFDVISGIEIWRHHALKGNHLLDAAFCSARNCFVGISWPYENGGPYTLHAFDLSQGECRPICDVGQAYCSAFCRQGNVLVNSEGSLFDVPSGKIIGRLPFPVK